MFDYSQISPSRNFASSLLEQVTQERSTKLSAALADLASRGLMGSRMDTILAVAGLSFHLDFEDSWPKTFLLAELKPGLYKILPGGKCEFGRKALVLVEDNSGFEQNAGA